jgi:hypothetical protein
MNPKASGFSMLARLGASSSPDTFHRMADPRGKQSTRESLEIA